MDRRGLAPGWCASRRRPSRSRFVIRNAGERITQSVIQDLAYLAFLAKTLFGTTGPLFEVAILHHTQCGTGFLADPKFLRRAAQATGIDESALRAIEAAEPDRTRPGGRGAPARIAATTARDVRLRTCLRHRNGARDDGHRRTAPAPAPAPGHHSRRPHAVTKGVEEPPCQIVR
ncbi:hypothetical protein [Streptomyces sp. NPDC096311]|uniref:hypothetical protein n=1 Tax=Streptomyces sp. NPDC096311 TaxID=3366083 RepID=UPI00380474FA